MIEADLGTTVAQFRGFEIRARSFQAGPEAFCPIFNVLWQGQVCFEHEFLSGDEHQTAVAASNAAVATARRWVVDHPIRVHYFKPRFEPAYEPEMAGPFETVEDAKAAPFPDGFTEAYFFIGGQRHVYRYPSGWQMFASDANAVDSRFA